MSRTHFRHIRLRNWFPPDDPVAVTIARLCILREDLLLEGQAIRQAEIRPLDANGESSRRLYFWRNSFRTLDSIKSAVHTLKCQRSFQDALAKEPKGVQEGFNKLENALDKIFKEFLKDLRNDIGGHVSQMAVRAALDKMEFDQKGLLQVGEKVGDQHYKFTAELILLMMLPLGSVKAPQKELKRRSRKVAIMMWAVRVIDEVFNTYATSRRLLD